MPETRIREMLQATPLVAILRKPVADLDLCVETLIKSGVRCIEITMDTPGAAEFLKKHPSEPGAILYGAGTVLNTKIADAAIEAGASFLVTPSFSPEVVALARDHERFIISGAMTPTEIYNAFQAGANMIKVFPAATLGWKYFR